MALTLGADSSSNGKSLPDTLTCKRPLAREVPPLMPQHPTESAKASPPSPATSALIASGVSVLVAWGSCGLVDYFTRETEAQAFIDRLFSALPDTAARALLLETIAPEAVRQVVTARNADAGETLIVFLGSLRLPSTGQALARDKDASRSLSDLQLTIEIYST